MEASAEGIVAFHPPRFDLATQPSEINNYLDEHGYVVVKGLKEEEVERAKDLFWAFIDGYVGAERDIVRNDARSWTRFPGDSKTGILNGPIAHSEYLWFLRLHPIVTGLFSLVWGTDDLLTSYDGGNVFRPWSVDPKYKTKGGWWHVDQNSMKGPDRQGRVSIQGLVTLYAANEKTGGFVIIPGSHKYHDQLCELFSHERYKIDFVSVRLDEENNPIRSLPRYLLCVEAGDIILWDSRTVHCNSPSLVPDLPPLSEEEKKETELLRLVGYVCMQPRSLATPAAIISRKKGMVFKVPTTHWAIAEIDKDIMELLQERATGNEYEEFQKAPSAKLKMCGFEEAEIRTRRSDVVPMPGLCTIQ